MAYPFILLLLIAGNFPAFAQAPAKLDTVALQLKWQHQFQFAGYYAALEKGYYREAGLDVRLIEGGPGREAVSTVVSGQADFGVSNSELLLHRQRGAPVVALAAIIQHSPLALLVRRDSGIRTVRDLAGRRLMIGDDAAELFAYFRRSGLDPNNIQQVPHSQDVTDLIEKRVDGFSSYITDQAFLLHRAGVDTIELRGVHAGIDFYGDTLFTSEQQLRDHPDRVRALRTASLKGWLYAFDHIEEMTQLIRAKYAPDRTLEHLRWEADGYRNLIVPDLVEIGHMSESRWRHIADTYAELAMLPQGFDFTGMLYNPNPRDLRWLYPWMIGGAAVVLLMAGFTVYVVRSREILRASEERFRAIIETEPECVKVVAPDGKLVEMNAAGLRMLQADSLAALSDKPLLEFVLPGYREAFGQLHQKVMRGESATLEFEIAGLKGRPLWLETHAAPLRDAAGRVTALLGVTRDITERKLAEEQLLYELQLIRNITDSADECIFIADEIGNIKFANPAAVHTFGYSLDELMGQSLHATLHHSYVDGRPFPKSDCPLAQTRIAGATIRNHEDVFFRKDGSPVIVECSNAPVEIDGKRFGAVLIARDITEREFNQAALQTSEQSIRQLYAITNDTRQSFEERVRALLNLGCERFRMPIGSLAKLNGDHIELQFVQSSSDPNFTDGMMVPLSSSYCRSVMDAEGPLCFEHVGASEWRHHPGYLALRLESYMGTKVVVDGEVYGTVCFMGQEPRPSKFTDADKDFLKLMSVWIGGELARRHAVHALRASHDELELRVEERTAELTRSNALLREKDQHLTLAQRAGHAGLWSRNLATGKASMSPEWHELIGFPVDEKPVSFAEFLDRVHPNDRARVEDLSLYQKIGDFDREFRIVHPVKGERWIFSRGRRGISTEDGHLHMMGALIDITERKQTEEALRRSEERLQHALTVGSMGLWERDLRTGKVQWDRRTFEILGIEAETSVDLEMLFSRIHPDDLPVVKSALDRTQSTGVVYVCEFRVLKPDGKIIWLYANGGLRRDRDGTPTHIAGINFDITERKRAEEALRTLSEDLDRRVVERTQELAESQARLRALVAELSRAEERERRRLAVELHDYLAQMLTVSRLNIGRAGKLAADGALKKCLAEAQESVDEAIAYTRSLMAQLSPRVLYDLGLPAALAWLGTQQKKRHGLDVEIRGEAKGFALDEDRSVLAYQCVRELLWNIVKHAETNQAMVSYKIEHGELTIEVTDDGQGFAPESLYANGNGVEKFGLFSIRERWELFGGKLEVTSQPGRGTRARLTLPTRQIEMAPIVEQEGALVSAALTTGKLVRVALVDDHEVVRRGLRQLLEGFADLTVVGEAKDGLEGVELARQFRPDVVVMDINMPGMNGIEATKLIIQEMPSTIVVGLSFDIAAEVARAMKAAGASSCVTKERAVEDIHQAIVDAVEERRVVAH